MILVTTRITSGITSMTISVMVQKDRILWDQQIFSEGIKGLSWFLTSRMGSGIWGVGVRGRDGVCSACGYIWQLITTSCPRILSSMGYMRGLGIVRGTPRFLPFLFYSWSLSVIIYSDFSNILLFHILLLIFSAVLLIFSTHSHIILTALALSLLFFWQLSEVISPALIFWHFDIISH
jgi:hypothetical protein